MARNAIIDEWDNKNNKNRQNKMLLNSSQRYLYWKGSVQPVSDVHSPYFLAFSPNLKEKRKELIKKWKNDEFDGKSNIKDIGEIEEYKSFWNPEIKRKVFKVYTTHSYLVPEVSDSLFKMGFYTAEHDIPYKERVLTDLASRGTWLFDSKGKEKKLRIMTYDIETTQYEEGATNIPIDIIGYSTFDLPFYSRKNLDGEEFDFEIVENPVWDVDAEVTQLVSHDIDEEVENLCKFCKELGKVDIISGHNILGFDNLQIYDRINNLKKNRLSKNEMDVFNQFLKKYSWREQTFHFGSPSNAAIFYPSSFDTYPAARKFYSLNDYSLKALAPFLDINVEGRIYLSPSQMKLDARTIKYNRQDVLEQLGVTMNLIQRALPLAFVTGMPFEELLTTGTTKMWDWMAMIRAANSKKIMPAICKVFSISKEIIDQNLSSKEEIVEKVRKEGAGKELTRLAKYGEEMPDWVEYPFIIYDKTTRDIAYHFPGGMTIKPDRDAHSHFIPWYHVIVADVGAMYPTILKAVNAGADTVRIAKKGEEPDEWIWLKRIPSKFLDRVEWKEARKPFEGIMMGIKVSREPGVVNMAMSGIMNSINKIKKEMKKKEGEERNKLRMIYQSLKGARNAGTHGILSAPTVSCRQFNLWGASLITTKGQQILGDSLKILKGKKIRVVYGDTDGIYLACSSSASEKIRDALHTKAGNGGNGWLTPPQLVIDAIDFCNKKWRKELGYQQFELEAEEHDAMIFVKHKNYLIFDAIDGEIKMIAKGNNFKGSDKPDIARIVLKEIMLRVLKENLEWNDEEEARENIKKSIKRETEESVSNLDLSKVDLEDLILVQSVQPSNRYKPNSDGSISVYGERTRALEKLVGKIRARRKFKFVVTKKALPGIKNPTKSGVKPIGYMYPLEVLENEGEIDLEWYKEMVKNFVKGAFGLGEISDMEQQGLDGWM